MQTIEQQDQLNRYREALDALIEIRDTDNADKYRKAINNLRADISLLEKQYDDN